MPSTYLFKDDYASLIIILQKYISDFDFDLFNIDNFLYYSVWIPFLFLMITDYWPRSI